MLLIYTEKITPRVNYIFKHIFQRIIGVEMEFTTRIDDFVAHSGPKFSYGKKPLSSELFVMSSGLLFQQGFESIDITVRKWEGIPCFFSVGSKSSIPFDIFSASFYLLSRYEEYLPHFKDEKGRYPAKESLAFREKFLLIPVVDLWASSFLKVLLTHFPDIQYKEKKPTKATAVYVNSAYLYLQRSLLKTTIAYLRDIVKFRFKNISLHTKVLLRLRKDPYNTFTWIVNTCKKTKIKTTVFFNLGEPIDFKDAVNTKREKFKSLVKFTSDYTTVGSLFSYSSLRVNIQKETEKKELESLTHRKVASSMNAEYSIKLPDDYKSLVELEIDTDYSLVYENVPGFRASTCTPFLFYDLDYEITTPLTIAPIAFSTAAMQSKHHSERVKVINQLQSVINEVKGTFIVIYTNKDFIPAPENNLWRALVSDTMNEA